MTVKLFFDRKPVMTLLSRESAEEFKARHSAGMQRRMEIKVTCEHGNGRKCPSGEKARP